MSEKEYNTENGETKRLYIVLSQTGTVLSRILKFVTGAKYNHVSVSVSEDLEQMYSFGRRNPYNPFWGGFVLESPYSGTFNRFRKTKVAVLAVEISAERYAEICEILPQMYSHRENYHYNYLGLYLAAIHIKREKDHCYYCSEFVKAICRECGVDGADQLPPIVQPIHFMDLPHTVVYCGKLREYADAM